GDAEDDLRADRQARERAMGTYSSRAPRHEPPRESRRSREQEADAADEPSENTEGDGGETRRDRRSPRASARPASRGRSRRLAAPGRACLAVTRRARHASVTRRSRSPRGTPSPRGRLQRRTTCTASPTWPPFYPRRKLGSEPLDLVKGL